jgi:hypothetical protein
MLFSIRMLDTRDNDNNGSRHGFFPSIYLQLKFQLSRTHPNLPALIIAIATFRSNETPFVSARKTRTRFVFGGARLQTGWLAGQVTGQGDATTETRSRRALSSSAPWRGYLTILQALFQPHEMS